MAKELNVTDMPFDVVAVGNGHIDRSMLACTVESLYGGLDISAQTRFIVHSARTMTRVASSWYRREAMPVIAQKRLGPDL